MNALDPILARTREDVSRRRRMVPLAALERAAHQRLDGPRQRPSFIEALRSPGLSLIAEHKRRSPSAGIINERVSLEDVVGAYERGGAAALSVLTEESSFGGSLEDLRATRARTALPVLRKDFVIDSYQLQESLVFGADAILLIVAALPGRELSELHTHALQLGLTPLVEVHDEHELELAVGAGAQLIGINNRDLTTLRVDTRRTFELMPKLPSGTTVVSESGYSRREQLEELADAGVEGVLIGEALMRAEDIERACRALTERRPAGRL